MRHKSKFSGYDILFYGVSITLLCLPQVYPYNEANYDQRITWRLQSNFQDNSFVHG